MTIGMYAGSFDPPHLGHLALIEQAARFCSTLYVVAAGNPDKLDSALFGISDRRELLTACTHHVGGVVCLEHRGLVADLATELEVQVLIRGMGKEMAGEFEMAVTNRQISGIPTVFVPPEPATRWISSRRVRADYLRDGDLAVAHMVPIAVVEALAARSVTHLGTA